MLRSGPKTLWGLRTLICLLKMRLDYTDYVKIIILIHYLTESDNKISQVLAPTFTLERNYWEMMASEHFNTVISIRWFKCRVWLKVSFSPTLSGLEILHDTTLIFQNWLVSKLFANIFHFRWNHISYLYFNWNFKLL